MRENKWLKNFLDKLSKANKKEYGDKPLDCCELNKADKDARLTTNSREKKAKVKTK